MSILTRLLTPIILPIIRYEIRTDEVNRLNSHVGRTPKQMFIRKKSQLVLKKHFTKKAQNNLSDVIISHGQPAWYPPISRDTLGAAFVNFGVIRVFHLQRSDRAIERTIVHEYLHVADYRGLINRDEFAEEYNVAMCGLPRSVAQLDVYGIEEKIACLGERIAANPRGIPCSMRKVYSGVLAGAKS